MTIDEKMSTSSISRFQFSLRRVLLLPVVLAVYLGMTAMFLPSSRTPIEEMGLYGPLWLVVSSEAMDRILGFAIYGGTGMSFLLVTLWPNRYSLALLAAMLAVWLFVTWLTACVAAGASC